jgi:histone acetyltransferase
MVPRIRYLEVQSVLARQKAAILEKIRQISRSHIVHRGADIKRRPDGTVDPSQVPALRDLGWNPQMDEL